MPDLQAMLAALLNSQAGTGPGIDNRPLQTITAPQPQKPPEEPGQEPSATAPDDEASEGPQPSDEEMLENVRQGMGGGDSPPPGSDMKWEDVNEDVAALQHVRGRHGRQRRRL